MDNTNQESKNLSLGQVSFMDKVSQIFDMIRTSDNDQSWKILVFVHFTNNNNNSNNINKNNLPSIIMTVEDVNYPGVRSRFSLLWLQEN